MLNQITVVMPAYCENIPKITICACGYASELLLCKEVNTGDF